MGEIRPRAQFPNRPTREEVRIRLYFMELSLLSHSSTNLPDDVFEPGETKPKPPLKKTAANGVKNEKKRNAPNEVCWDDGWWIAAWADQCHNIPQDSPTLKTPLTHDVGRSPPGETTTIDDFCRCCRLTVAVAVVNFCSIALPTRYEVAFPTRRL